MSRRIQPPEILQTMWSLQIGLVLFRVSRLSDSLRPRLLIDPVVKVKRKTGKSKRRSAVNKALTLSFSLPVRKLQISSSVVPTQCQTSFVHLPCGDRSGISAKRTLRIEIITSVRSTFFSHSFRAITGAIDRLGIRTHQVHCNPESSQ